LNRCNVLDRPSRGNACNVEALQGLVLRGKCLDDVNNQLKAAQFREGQIQLLQLGGLLYEGRELGGNIFVNELAGKTQVLQFAGGALGKSLNDLREHVAL
jgi:hypothetical protein